MQRPLEVNVLLERSDCHGYVLFDSGVRRGSFFALDVVKLAIELTHNRVQQCLMNVIKLELVQFQGPFIDYRRVIVEAESL